MTPVRFPLRSTQSRLPPPNVPLPSGTPRRYTLISHKVRPFAEASQRARGRPSSAVVRTESGLAKAVFARLRPLTPSLFRVHDIAFNGPARLLRVSLPFFFLPTVGSAARL